MSNNPTTTGSLPCWYELGTTDVTAAGAFYENVLGWKVVPAGVPGFDYSLANDADGNGVAGMMSLADQVDAPPPNWVIYFEVADADATAEAIGSAGGSMLTQPADIPGTGRFAIAADPQGAVFGILQPLTRDTTDMVRAYDQNRSGHGNWHELSTTDVAAALEFYGTIFGWSKGETMDMGTDGVYQLFQAGGGDLGGMMGLGEAPAPAWLTYFGADGVNSAIERITSAGGTLVHGPSEVPGGAFIAVAADPQGAPFAVVGPKG